MDQFHGQRAVTVFVHRSGRADFHTFAMRAVEPYKLLFFEEPLHYTDLNGYSALYRSSNVPIAGGECLPSHVRFDERDVETEQGEDREAPADERAGNR